ncbi:MAG: ribonucleotide-diphosphate reductase subunit beta [Candidatus Acidiferrales bacterium]
MLEVRQVSDHDLEAIIGGAQLRAMDHLYIDDVLAVVGRGLDRLPSYLDLYRKAVKQAWNPDDLDFSKDKAEWEQLSPETKRRRVWGDRLFFNGEERVASLLAPFVWAAPSKEVEAFAATQLADEVRHTIFFERYWREVVGTSASGLNELVKEVGIKASENEAYSYVFDEWLPAQAQWLAAHPRDLDATVRFVTAYHLVVEGALFLTGMRYQLEGARRWGRTWGYYKGFTATTRDESRHVLFGVTFLRDMVKKDPLRFVPIIQSTIQESLPLLSNIMEPPGSDMTYYGGKHLSTAWPGYTPTGLREEMVDYAKGTISRHLHAVGIQMAI